MKKIFAFLSVCLVAVIINAQSGATFKSISEFTRNTSLSPNGKYAVGISTITEPYGLDVAQGFSSYFWDLEKEDIEWKTEFIDTDYAKSGYFADINNDKVIVGHFKDPNYIITIKEEWGESHSLPLNVAAIWKDGQLTSLGTGNYTINDFSNFADGSFATALTGDSKTVVGFIASGNFASYIPCAWNYDEQTGKYVYQRYNLPEGAKNGRIMSISDDGAIAVGIAKFDIYTKGCIWTSPENCIVIEDTNTPKPEQSVGSGGAYEVSPNGKYIACTFDGKEPVLYLTNEKRYFKLGTYEDVTGLMLNAVSNTGDIVGCYKYGLPLMGDIFTRPFWYSINTLQNVGFDYFAYLYAWDVELPYTFKFESKENLSIVSISEDGKTILGNETWLNESWFLKTKAEAKLIPPTVQNINAKVTALQEVTVTIPRLEYEGFMSYDVSTYKIYRDGEILTSINVADLEVSDTILSYIDKNVTPGWHYYSSAPVYKDQWGDPDLEAPRLSPVKIAVEDTYALPLYDDFESSSLDYNYWTVQRDYGETNYQNWGCIMYLGLQSSFSLHTTVDQLKPYSYSLVSRHIDATQEENIYLSFAKMWRYANSRDWPLDKDTISIEVSTDGMNWKRAKSFALDQTPSDYWSFDYIDLSSLVAGHIFQARIRAHGQAAAQTSWDFDLLKIGTTPEHEAPQGLMGLLDKDQQLNLNWKNSLGAYSLSYLTSPYTNCYSLAIGDDGKPIIAANSFTQEDLQFYKGKYLTSVTTFINHDFEIPDSKDTHASVVIFENNQLIHEQEINVVYNKDLVIQLDKPILIDGTKEIKIGIKIFDYDSRQIPLAYQNTLEYVPGKSDLYSQDGGTTWQKLSDFFATVPDHETDGYACWEITGNITDEEVAMNVELDEDLFAYEIYRNGEKISPRMIYWTEPKFIDTNATIGDKYQIRAFYIDGTVSLISDICENQGISNIEQHKKNENDISVFPNPATDYICISGTFDSATLLNINGQAVVSTTKATLSLSGLPAGVYILRVESGDHVYTEKIMIER